MQHPAINKDFPILDARACPRCPSKPCYEFSKDIHRGAVVAAFGAVHRGCPLLIPPLESPSRYRIYFVTAQGEMALIGVTPTRAC